MSRPVKHVIYECSHGDQQKTRPPRKGSVIMNGDIPHKQQKELCLGSMKWPLIDRTVVSMQSQPMAEKRSLVPSEDTPKGPLAKKPTSSNLDFACKDMECVD